jgi:predicted transcriptional regulator
MPLLIGVPVVYTGVHENSYAREFMDTEKVDPHLTATIVGSYVRHHTVGAGQLSDLITTVHRALGDIGKPNQAEEVRTPAVSVRRSVSQDYVVCMDCGYRGKTLRRHISTQHGLDRDEYLRRWGLRSDHPLTAPAYSERRSILAKELGLGRKSTAEMAPVASPIATPAPADADGKSEATPAPKRRSRSASKSADVASEAVTEGAPARRRRSGSRGASPQPKPVSSPTAET